MRYALPLAAASLLVAPAATATAETAAPKMAEHEELFLQQAELRRQVTDIVARAYGADPSIIGDDDDSDELSDEVYLALKPGARLPEGAPAEDAPAPIADQLPEVHPGAKWWAIGDHLAEVGEDGTIYNVVYDVLP